MLYLAVKVSLAILVKLNHYLIDYLLQVNDLLQLLLLGLHTLQIQLCCEQSVARLVVFRVKVKFIQLRSKCK